MRFIVVGAGAIGGVIGGRLHQHGHDVVLVARGDHYRALADHGLQLQAPEGTVHLDVPVEANLGAIGWRDGDVVIMAVKSQDTRGVLADLDHVAPPDVPIVCAQNGVDNERAALRVSSNVYAMCVMCPATHLSPGTVSVYSSPVSGVLDLGRWPTGIDATAGALASALEASSFRSQAVVDIGTLKWGKLLSNLNNAIEALCGPLSGPNELSRRVRDEAVEALGAHGVDALDASRALGERMSLVGYQPIGGAQRGGGSSWQSLERATGHIETEYLNGEIVLLARLAGLTAPANALLVRRANEAAWRHRAPGSTTVDELLHALG